MNLIVQNILVALAFSGAVGFLIKKIFWKTSVTSGDKKSTKSCKTSGCGCH